ncbi:MAG TPA: DUF1206 domain-containing protein [Jatrophihabitans sp.]|nr:DUF1206 domain-containing protein [Jatrophihabitans sp.]
MSAMTAARPALARRPVVHVAARVGLVARGLVYLLLGWLAIRIAVGNGSQQANQKGALATVASHSGGKALLVGLAIGFAAYALWRLSEAAFGTSAEGNGAGARLKSLVRGLVYVGSCIVAIRFLAGSPGKSQDKQQADLTARLMQHTGGRWLVGIIGLVVLGVGIGMAVSGFKRQFTRELQVERMTPNARKTVIAVGAFGHVARGVVVALVGVLVIAAAITTDPKKSTGLDGALRTLADQTMGRLLLGVIAVGLAAFGAYGLAAAKWART